MEITALSEGAIKVKGKVVAFAVNALGLRSKTNAQGVLFFQKLKEPFDTKYFEEEPLVIQGPGDYEIGGVKITGNKAGDGYVYQIVIDGIEVLIAKGSFLPKAKDIPECHIVILDADSLVDQAALTALNPNVIVFFGEKKEESAKAFVQETPTVSKFSVTKDKLPIETQIVVMA